MNIGHNYFDKFVEEFYEQFAQVYHEIEEPVPSVEKMWELYQVPDEDVKLLESCFGLKSDGFYAVWYQVDAGDHIRLSDWGFENRTGVQVRDNCLAIQIYNDMMDVRCDWRFIYVKCDAIAHGQEAIRQFVTK